jgi:hypothetical protein
MEERIDSFSHPSALDDNLPAKLKLAMYREPANRPL